MKNFINIFINIAMNILFRNVTKSFKSEYDSLDKLQNSHFDFLNHFKVISVIFFYFVFVILAILNLFCFQFQASF